MNQRTKSVGAALVAALLAACGPAPAPSIPPAGAPAAPSPDPVAAPGPAAAAPSAAAPAATAPARPKASPFVGVAEVPHDGLRLHPIEGALLVSTDHTLIEVSKDETRDGILIGVVQDGKVDFPERMRLGGYHAVVALSGRWPDEIDLLATGTTGRTGIAEHHRLDAKGWTLRHSSTGDAFVGLTRLGGSVLAVQAPFMSQFGKTMFVALRGPKPAAKLTPVAKKECMIDGWDPPSQTTVVLPATLGSTRDGSLLSYGTTCGETPSPAVELWKPGAATSTVFRFEGQDATDHSAGAASQILAGAGSEAWLLTGRVMRFDGATWKAVDPPPPGPVVTDGAVGPDGALWVIAGGSLFARRGDRWEPVPLPMGLPSADDLAVTDDGTLWLAGGGALFRQPRPGDAPGAAPPAIQPKVREPKPRRAFPKPGSPKCKQNLVVLYGFTKVTPEDYDFPLTRKALKGHTEYQSTRFLVTRDVGQRFLAAVVPTFDVGRKLQALIEKEVQGSKPQVVCAEPEVIRELKIDLRTGEVMK